jgi:uncharacterized protein YegL
MNCVWGSIDPRSGDINIYPKDISNKIEGEYIEHLLDNNRSSIQIPEYYNINIHFSQGKFTQTTQGGYRDVFRETIDKIEGDELTILKIVRYNQTKGAWYLKKPKVTHIGFCVDTSGSMTGTYHNVVEQGIEEFLEKQKEVENDVYFYGLTFSNKINVLYDHVDLKTQTDIRDKYYKIKCRGSTAYYDAFIQVIENIDRYYDEGDEVIICTMTDGQDNSSNNTLGTLRRVIKECKDKDWIVVMFGTNDIDTAKTSTNMGIGFDSGLEIGKTVAEQSNAFKSLSNGIQRVRTGETPSLSFTPLERNISSQRRI